MKTYDLAFLLVGLIFVAGMLVGKEACACAWEEEKPIEPIQVVSSI